MTTFTFDGVAMATPLAQLKSGEAVNTMDMLLGRIPGTIGETSVIITHYFSPPFPNGFGRVTFSISGTKRLLKIIA